MSDHQQQQQESNQDNIIDATASTRLFDTMMRSAAAEGGGGIQGILCNDPNGLCLATSGEPIGGGNTMIGNDNNINNNNNNNKNSGIYTSLVRLANQLEEASVSSSHPNASTSLSTPLITIETESFNILVKEYYNGNTVAMKVPTHAHTSINGGTDGSMIPNDTTTFQNNNNNSTTENRSDTKSTS